MIRRILTVSIKFRALLVVLAGALIIVGSGIVSRAPVDALPEFTAPVVDIQTESLGLAANEVEQMLTVPMEQDLLNGVKNAQTIRSDSVPGVSSIELTFPRGTDILRARQLIQERLTQAYALPGVGKPPQMIQPVSSSRHVMLIGLTSAKLSAIELSVLARWTVRPRLMGLPGVANVAIWGMRDRQFQVLVDPARLHAHGVSLNQVIATAGNAQLVSRLSFLEASTPGTGGFVDGPSQRLSVRHVLPFAVPKDLAQVPVEGTKGRRAVPLGSVAQLTEGHQPLIGDAVVHGGAGLVLVVDKLPGASTLAVTHEIDRALVELRPGFGGVAIDASVYRPATFIESALHHLAVALAIGAALAMLALIAFIRRWRAVFVVVVTVPLSLLVAVLVLGIEGQTINSVLLAGLGVGLGVVIDDAVGASFTVSRLLRKRDGRGDAQWTIGMIVESSLRLRTSLAYASVIVLLAAVPILVSHGLAAAFVHPMALAFVFAVIASMLVALTVAPALSVLVASLPSRPERRARVEKLARSLSEAITRNVRGRPVILATCALGLLTAVAIPLLMAPRVPSYKDRDLLVRLETAPGTSLPAMERVTTRAAVLMRALPGVRDAGANVGRAVTGDQIVGTNSAQVWVSMKPAADYGKTMTSIRNVVSELPGASGSVMTDETANTSGVLDSPGDRITVRVYGADYGILGQQAARVRAVFASVDGLSDPRVALPVRQATIRVEVNLAAALRQQVKPGDVRRAAATLVSGTTVGDFFEQQKVFEVVVRGVASTHNSLSSIRNLLIDTPDGDQVRLGSIARVSLASEPVDIRHDAVSRYVDVSAAVRGGNDGSLRAQIQHKLAQLAMPLEYNAEVLGGPADAPTTTSALVSFVAAALLGIFLLLQAAFSSWRLAAVAALMLPASLLGGFLTAVATGNRHALGAAAGLVAVFAIAARHVVVLIRAYRGVGHERGEARARLAQRAVQERSLPTIASTTATAIAIVPFALLGDVAGNEITYSMSLVILGGLVTMILLLATIPAACELVAPPTGGSGRPTAERPTPPSP